MRPLFLALSCLACAEPVPLGPVDASAPVESPVDAGAHALDAPAPGDATASMPDARPMAMDAAAPDAGPVDTGRSRYPLVLAHGWAASDTVLGFARVGAELERAGYRVLVTVVPPFDSAEVRAGQLAAQIDALLARSGAGKVNLVAHSMGGLDARALISGLGYGDRVASLSTIGTPHRGTAVADVILGLQAGASTAAVDALGRIFGARVSSVESDPQVRASLAALSEDAAPAFNAAYPDDPRVFYQSWAGLSNVYGIRSADDESACETLLFDPSLRDTMDAALVPLAAMAAHGLRVWSNDGLVPVSSAKWGVYRGCIAADHADEVGAFDDAPPDPRTGFDFLEFYRTLADELAARGL